MHLSFNPYATLISHCLLAGTALHMPRDAVSSFNPHATLTSHRLLAGTALHTPRDAVSGALRRGSEARRGVLSLFKASGRHGRRRV